MDNDEDDYMEIQRQMKMKTGLRNKPQMEMNQIITKLT